MTIGDAIRAARKARGLWQAEAAQTAGIAVNSWRLYEGDKRSPTCETLDRIAHALSVPVSSLVPDFAPEIKRLTDRCARYAEEIAVLQERTRWIPVEKRLPEPGKRVLATSGVFVGEAFRAQSGVWSRSYGVWGDWIGYPVTHWMPLPDGSEVE